jgi:hypothetical protein
MTFKVQKNPSFTHDVEVSLPIDGGFEKIILSTRFNYLGMDELEKFELSSNEGQDQFFAKAIVTFNDLVDDEGKPIACDASVRAQILGLTNVRIALMAAYTLALQGAARKN